MKRYLLLLVFFCTPVFAQSFLFTSNRVPDLSLTYEELPQTELFVYQDGSEIRLTHTLELSEYDAVVSPDGSKIALAASDHIIEGEQQAWQLYYRVIDSYSGELLASWVIPNSSNEFRPAGGFGISWLDDQRFLAQVYGAAIEGDYLPWEIHQFSLGQTSSKRIGLGFGIFLSPDARSITTNRDGQGYVIDIVRKTETALLEGFSLGWQDNSHVLMDFNSALVAVDVANARPVLVGDSGPYWLLKWSPERRRYAYTSSDARGGTAISFHQANNDYIDGFSLDYFIGEFTWINEEQLVLEASDELGSFLLLFDLYGREWVLVNSVGDDYLPSAWP